MLCEVINQLPPSHTPTLFTPETVLWEVVECFGKGLFEDTGDSWDVLLGSGQEASLSCVVRAGEGQTWTSRSWPPIFIHIPQRRSDSTAPALNSGCMLTSNSFLAASRLSLSFFTSSW